MRLALAIALGLFAVPATAQDVDCANAQARTYGKGRGGEQQEPRDHGTERGRAAMRQDQRSDQPAQRCQDHPRAQVHAH